MPLADRLRADTRVHHLAVERESPMAWLMDPAVDRETCAAVLARLHAFQAPVEATLAPHLLALGLRPVNRAARLAADLAVLGRTPPAAAPLHAHPLLDTPARARGGAYVLEGAALGGQLLARHLGARLGLTPESGLSFFASEGESVGARWRAVRRMLDAAPESEHAAAAAAAADTFDCLGEWMRGLGGPMEARNEWSRRLLCKNA